MKKNNKVSTGKKFGHFMKHYFGFVLLALACAVLTVLTVAMLG